MLTILSIHITPMECHGEVVFHDPENDIVSKLSVTAMPSSLEQRVTIKGPEVFRELKFSQQPNYTMIRRMCPLQSKMFDLVRCKKCYMQSLLCIAMNSPVKRFPVYAAVLIRHFCCNFESWTTYALFPHGQRLAFTIICRFLITSNTCSNPDYKTNLLMFAKMFKSLIMSECNK